MGSGFPLLLAYVFLASLVLGVLRTSWWQAALISVIVVWCVRISQTEIDLLAAGTTQAYAWLALLAAAFGFPTLVVATVGADLGLRLRGTLFDGEAEIAEAEKAPEAHHGEGEEAAGQ